jgi:hypothetical protein
LPQARPDSLPVSLIVRLSSSNFSFSFRDPKPESKVQAAILDEKGRFLAVNRTKVQVEVTCRRHDGKWHWRLGSSGPDLADHRIQCVLARKLRKGCHHSADSSEERRKSGEEKDENKCGGKHFLSDILTILFAE